MISIDSRIFSPDVELDVGIRPAPVIVGRQSWRRPANSLPTLDSPIWQGVLAARSPDYDPSIIGAETSGAAFLPSVAVELVLIRPPLGLERTDDLGLLRWSLWRQVLLDPGPLSQPALSPGSRVGVVYWTGHARVDYSSSSRTSAVRTRIVTERSTSVWHRCDYTATNSHRQIRAVTVWESVSGSLHRSRRGHTRGDRPQETRDFPFSCSVAPHRPCYRWQIGQPQTHRWSACADARRGVKAARPDVGPVIR